MSVEYTNLPTKDKDDSDVDSDLDDEEYWEKTSPGPEGNNKWSFALFCILLTLVVGTIGIFIVTRFQSIQKHVFFSLDCPKACSKEFINDGWCDEKCRPCPIFWDNDVFDGGDCELNVDGKHTESKRDKTKDSQGTSKSQDATVKVESPASIDDSPKIADIAEAPTEPPERPIEPKVLPPPIPTPKPTEPTPKPTEPTPKPTEGKMNKIMNQLNGLKAGVQEMREMLVKYYTKDPNIPAEKFLAESFQFRREGKLFEQAFEHEVDRFARAFVQDRMFIVGVIGSSVAAGHDNCEYDNYESQLNRLMQPVFEKAGMAFEVRNGGMTGGCGDAYKNQIWCFPHTVGEVDMIHYTWTYFEHGGESPPYHEAFYRWTQMTKRRPVPLLMYTNKRTEFDRLRDDKELLETYTPLSGANILYMQGGLQLYGYTKDHNEGTNGDKIHDNVRYAETQEEFRRQKLGVVYRNWHPGPLQFQTLSDTLAFHMSYAILEAIKRIFSESDPVRKWGSDPESVKLPKPLMCDKQQIPCDTQTPPICHNGEKPTWGEPGVVYLNKTDDRRVEKEDRWHRHLDHPTELFGMREEAKLEKCHHLDQCGGWQRTRNQEAGWLEFLFPGKLEKGLLYFCAKGIGDAKSGGKEMLDQNPIIKVNGKLIPNGQMRDVFGKCIQVTQPGDLPENTVLSISFPPNALDYLVDHVMGI